MKKVLIVAALLISVSGCGVNNSSNIDFDGNKIKYVQDQRTGLCFAVSASRKTGEFDTTGMGLANVECTEKVLKLIE